MQFRKWLVVMLAVCALAPLSVSAQIETVIPIEIGQNISGEITAESPTQIFNLNVSVPTVIEVQVLALNPQFLPAFSVVDALGVTIQRVENSGAETTLRQNISLSTPGDYQIEIRGANGTSGQFVLSVQFGAALEPPQPLVLGQASVVEISPDQPRKAFSFSGLSSDFLFLSVEIPPELLSGPVVILSLAETGERLMSASSQLSGVRLRLPASEAAYLLEVIHDADTPAQQISVCLEAENGLERCTSVVSGSPLAASSTPTVNVTQTPESAFVLPTLPATGGCILATTSSTVVNVRNAPDLNAPVVTQLSLQQVATVIGRLADSSWWQVIVNGVTGWVSGSVTRVGGNCSAVAATTPMTPTAPVTATPTATGATATPTATIDLTTSATPTNTATVTPTFTPTDTATVTATFTPTNTPGGGSGGGTVNAALSPIFGSTALTSGFMPDPFTTSITANGPVNMNSLGGGCSGFASSAPSFSVNYTSGSFPTLRFYFIGSGDTTMVINTPGGGFFCSDDSFGTVDPTIDFSSPASGRYNVWIGTFTAGRSLGGTLYVTENTANHP